MKILFIDDCPSIIEMFQFTFQDQKLKSSYALGGEDALEIILKEDFDLVVCDLEMPRVNGVNFANEMRKLGKNTRIIFFSGSFDVKLTTAISHISNHSFIGDKNFDTLRLEVNKLLGLQN